MSVFKAKLIAPCGMNCNICSAYLREKNKCPGCKEGRVNCKVKKCRKLDKYCFNCKDIPCQRLKHLDKRYRTKYGMSMLNNLKYIKRYGIRKFVRKEEKKWTCKDGVICVHNKKCYPINL